MAARRALKAFNWGALAERIPEAERNSFATLKAKYDQYFRLVQEYPETPTKIDWADYKSKIALPGLVDKFQKEYESYKVEYPQDKYTSQLDSFEKQVDEHIQKFISDSNKRIEEYKAEVTKLEGLLKYGQMTLEDFKDAHPDLALDPLNRPTIFPHFPEYQPGPDDDKEKSHH